ncbi:MAG: hypothetical protein H9Q65_03325 [Spiroplasma ixodetis]|nr:hypothetical protein [Spiroplasma ixodetis]
MGKHSLSRFVCVCSLFSRLNWSSANSEISTTSSSGKKICSNILLILFQSFTKFSGAYRCCQ